jgi:hypothetical protein
MRHIAIWLVTLALGSCVSCGGSAPPPVNWPAVVACSGPAQADMLATVQRVLLDRNTEPTAELERLAEQHTPDMIACVVDQAVRHFAALASAPATAPQARTMAAEPSIAAPTVAETSSAEVAAVRGRDFLQRVGTSVEGTAE